MSPFLEKGNRKIVVLKTQKKRSFVVKFMKVFQTYY